MGAILTTDARYLRYANPSKINETTKALVELLSLVDEVTGEGEVRTPQQTCKQNKYRAAALRVRAVKAMLSLGHKHRNNLV